MSSRSSCYIDSGRRIGTNCDEKKKKQRIDFYRLLCGSTRQAVFLCVRIQALARELDVSAFFHLELLQKLCYTTLVPACFITLI